MQLGEPPSKEYQAYSMQEGKPVQNGSNQYYEQVAQQETDMNYQQQQAEPSANPFRADPSSNPFRR